MKNKSNKIIAFILSMVMLLSTVLPNLSSDVFGVRFSNSTTGSVEPVVEYSDSGQTLPEKEVTGTDIDNFKFSLKYGTIEDSTENDTLFVKDQSNKINATLRVEYTGDKVFNAGDLSMTFNYPTGIYRNYPNHDMLSDVGAELKGSGSGRGDWYYTRKNGELTFINKQATTGSFTSSIEIVLEMPDIRNVINGFNSTMSASFKINGIDTVLNSKTLFFATETTHDEMELTDIKPRAYTYTTYSTDSSTYIYDNYKLDDYYIMNIRFESKLNYFSRGFNMTDVLTLPEGCLFINTKKNIYTETRKITLSKDNSGFLDCYIAIPKNTYTAGEEITITWNKSAVFFDDGEIWEDTLEKNFCILDNIINVKNVSVSLSMNKSVSRPNIWAYEFGENGGVDFYWNIPLKANSGYHIDSETFAPAQTVIKDENTFVSSLKATDIKNKSRDLEEDEYYLTYIEFIPKYQNIINTCNIDIYAKKDTDAEYALVKSFEYQNENVKIDLDTQQRYTDFKIVINGNWINNASETNTSIDIHVGAYVNLTKYEKYLCNEVRYEETLNNGEHKVYPSSNTSQTFAHITIYQPCSGVYSSANRKGNPILQDNKICYNPEFSGHYLLSCPTEKSNEIKIHKLAFDIFTPSYLNFKEITNDNFTISGKVYSENDNSLISNSVTSDYFDIDIKTYNEENSKRTSIKVNIKDGYYIKYIGTTSYWYNGQNLSTMTGSFKFKPTMYIDYDVYSLLLNIGKLPTSFQSSITNYSSEEIAAYGIPWAFEKHSSTMNLSIPSLAGNTYQGVEKFVNTGSGFTKDLSSTTPGGDYSYKLRIAGGETTLDSIVIYDNLEEAYGDNEYWKGTFNGLDTTLLDMICEGEDYNYTVYYSKDKNQAFDLSDADWIKEADWTDALSDVKSIAIDLGGIRLNPKSLAYVIVNMKAPENANPGLKAYNSYAADYKAYDSSTGTLMETIKALPSNTTEVIYNKNITYTVNKVWDGKAADSVEVKLFANSEEKETITLNADNKWTHTFTDLPALDDSFSPIEYTVEETALNLYNTSYETVTDKDGNITTTVVNTRVPDIYTITKVWNINSEKIKLNIKTESGYDAEYDYINILDNDGNILERIDFEKLGLVISKKEYKTDKTYTAEVHMKDGKVYKTSINMNKFTPTPVECDLYVDGKVVDTFTLNEENGWKYTIIPSEKNNTNAISLYSDDVIISDADDIIIVDPGDNPGGDDAEPHEYSDLDGVCAECGKTQEDGNHVIIGDAEGDNTGGSNTGGDNTGNDNTGSDNNHHEYVDDNGICSVCGKSKDEHSKGIVIGKDDDEGVPVLPEAPSEPHSVKEKTKGEWKTSITHTENGNNIDYTITNDVEHEIEISTITIPDPEPPVDTGNNNYLWIYLLMFGIGLTGIFFSRKKKAII